MAFSTLLIGSLVTLLTTIPIIIKSRDKDQTYEENKNEKNEGSFKVLSYNIAGLWDLISESHPKQYISKIEFL